MTPEEAARDLTAIKANLEVYGGSHLVAAVARISAHVESLTEMNVALCETNAEYEQAIQSNVTQLDALTKERELLEPIVQDAIRMVEHTRKLGGNIVLTIDLERMVEHAEAYEVSRMQKAQGEPHA